MGLSWTELLIVGIVALIVIGPKELPALMNRLGKMAATVRRMGQDFQRELNKTTGLNEVKNLRDSITQPLKATADSIRREFNTTTASGATVPSGAIKPADPKAESVVAEIREAAGLPAADAPKPAPAPVPAAPGDAPVAAAAPAKTGPVALAAETAAAAAVTAPVPVKARRKTLAEQVSPPDAAEVTPAKPRAARPKASEAADAEPKPRAPRKAAAAKADPAAPKPAKPRRTTKKPD